MSKKTWLVAFLSTALAEAMVTSIFAAPEAKRILAENNISGGIVVRIGSHDPALQSLGERFHVRLLPPDEAAVAKARAAIDQAGLTGRFTASAWTGGVLPFADRVVNALILDDPKTVADAESRRVLAPGGVLISPSGARTMPVPDTIDEWTHFLHNASGNAVSTDKEVASPVSFRWRAAPYHLRSHDWGSSFQGLVTGAGRMFHLWDESPSFFSQGGIPEKWSLVARDAFNGALLWKRPVAYDYNAFESSGHQKIWRAPLSLNRRAVVQGDLLIAALSYRDAPLSILDGATGKTLREVDLGGSVDEIIAAGGMAVCRVRDRIPAEAEDPGAAVKRRARGGDDDGSDNGKNVDAKVVRGWKTLGFLRQQPERVVAVDVGSGSILWERTGPTVANQALAMADGILVYHNYDALIALEAKSGKELWTHPTPLKEGTRFGIHHLLGNLIIAEGKVVWTSNQTGGIGLGLADGAPLWTSPRANTTGGFQYPVGQRVIRGVLYSERGPVLDIATGKSVREGPDIGDMLRRGHHIRCFPGKATERFLITPHRGAEFVDLEGDAHMINDWIRGACSYGNLPANGLFYVTPDPCVCYAGTKINGFQALAPQRPGGMESAPAADDPARLARGPAYGKGSVEQTPGAWSSYRSGAKRLNQSPSPLAPQLAVAWTADLGGEITQATIANGKCYVINKDRYELLCLDLSTGKPVWQRAFPAAVDGPPTLLGERLFLGCRSGEVYALSAAAGALAWMYRAAPLDRLTLDHDRLESLWPVSGPVLYQNGLIYALAGRNSYLDGGLRLVALDPATGQVKHHHVFDGPWPTPEQLREGVVFKSRKAKDATPDIAKTIQDQYATGYSIPGGDADLLVGDGEAIYLTQNKFSADLRQIPLKREGMIGLTPMGGMHMMSQHGFLDGSWFHRGFQLYDDRWMTKAGGAGSAARGGNVVAVGKEHAYAAKHYRHDWYPDHELGSGNRLLRDPLTTENERADRLPKKLGKELGFYSNASSFVRTAKPDWEIDLPIIVRSLLVAPDAQGGEQVFAAGIVEGGNVEEWVRAAKLESPSHLYVINGADGAQLAKLDLPACPLFDGMSAAEGKLLVPLIDGRIVCLTASR